MIVADEYEEKGIGQKETVDPFKVWEQYDFCSLGFHIIIIIIIIIIILLITFMAGVYNYIPETNHVSRVYSVAAVLYLQFVRYT